MRRRRDGGGCSGVMVLGGRVTGGVAGGDSTKNRAVTR